MVHLGFMVIEDIQYTAPQVFPEKFQTKKNLRVYLYRYTVVCIKKKVKLTHLTGHPEVLAGAVARLKQI